MAVGITCVEVEDMDSQDPDTVQWISARLQYLQCVNNGDTAVLHWAMELTLYWSNPDINPLVTDRGGLTSWL